MENLLIYLVRSFICLGVLYFVWWLFMSKDTFFTVNRYYLISSILFSVIIPLINFSSITSFGSVSTSIILYSVTIDPGEIQEVYTSNLSVFQVITVIYLTGVGIFILRFLIQLIQIVLLIKRYGVTKKEGMKIVFTDSNYAPFSFFNLMFLNSKFNDEDLEKVIIHERVHIKQVHSLDLLILELLTIIQWFNPFTWLYRNSIKTIHEYLADEGVLLKGFDRFSYQQLLLSMSLGIQVNDLTNNINKTYIKRRFSMMTRDKSGFSSSLKYTILLPVALSVLVLFGINDLPSKTFKLNIKDSICTKPDKEPSFIGGTSALQQFIIKNIKYPEECKKNGINGRVIINFVVNKNGKIEKIEVAKSVHPDLDNEGIRVISIMPDWIPGSKAGEPVDVRVSLPFNFKLQ